MKRASLAVFAVLFVSHLHVLRADDQPRILAVTTPKEHFGFNMGDDYCLANYKQLAGYWYRLARESDRLKLVQIGVTEEGRPQLMGIVTSPANHKNLPRYQEIARGDDLCAHLLQLLDVAGHEQRDAAGSGEFQRRRAPDSR